MKYFAVGLNRNWVEVRTAIKPIQEVKSRAVRNYVIPRGATELIDGVAGETRQLILETVCHIGGKVVATVPRFKFLMLVKKLGVTNPPKIGGMSELTPQVGSHFESESWRKENGITL